MHVATNAVPKVDGRVIHRGTKEGDSPEITAEAERDLGYPNSIIEPGNSPCSISPSTASCARAIWLGFVSTMWCRAVMLPHRAIVMQKKTQRPVQFEITEPWSSRPESLPSSSRV